MKLIKTIKLHRKLRIRQEYLCYKVCRHSQNRLEGSSPFLNEFSSVNRAVEKINNKLPGIYFLLSDLFGGAISLKNQSKEYIKEREEAANSMQCPTCKSIDIVSLKTFKRTGGPRVPGKLMSYGYEFYKNYCNDCNNKWDGDKIN